MGSSRAGSMVVLLSLVAAGCGSEESSPGASSGGGAGSGGGGGAAGSVGACEPKQFPPAGAFPEPSPADIQFTVTNPLPAGEQILFNDWNPLPNALHSIRPDGSGEIEVLRAYRLWSLGASGDGRRFAFACGDPNQEQNYGLSLGDAIQHTWLYDVATQGASVLSWGNLNDECHQFAAAGDALYVCRRADFTQGGAPPPYRIARLSLCDGIVEHPTSPEPSQLELHPTPDATETTLYYTLIEIAAGQQTRRIVAMPLAGGAPSVVRESATLAALSPDGSRLLFADHLQGGALYTSALDGSSPTRVASHAGTSAVYSPDGSRIAYLWDETSTCHHIETVAADGSQADTPVRVRDCGTSFITALAWLTVD